MTARLTEVRDEMKNAADEETDHLAWCEQRLEELGSRTSLLNPVFYAGSFAIGALAGAAGDRWSLGFVAETEDQVVRHLRGHLEQVPAEDRKTKAVLEKMSDEEARHAANAREGGGVRLPFPIRLAMRMSSKVMTSTTYWV
jgi:ubiquinone biosynthesis monooxygenase Coq7